MVTQTSCYSAARHWFSDIVSTVVVAASLLASTAPIAYAASNQNPGIIPPNATYQGLTYREWLAAFNQWSLSIPAAQNPLLSGNEAYISEGQPEHLWFLGNSAPVVDRHFVVPAGTALFAVIVVVEWDNQLCTEPDTQYSLDELRAIAKSYVDSVTGIQVEVDGVVVKDVTQYRSVTPVFYSTIPDQNILQSFGCADASRGTYGPMVADGYALILPPQPVGEHTIHETALDGAVDVTWRISVVPHNS